MENDTEVPQKAEKRATIFSSNSTRSKEIRNINPENIRTSILITALVTIAEEWKQSINRKRKCEIKQPSQLQANESILLRFNIDDRGPSGHNIRRQSQRRTGETPRSHRRC